jgi:hypothetical protein
MRLNDWLTLGAIVLGPIVAVGITLVIEKSRKTHERRVQIMRMLLATRHMPADAQYNAAINLIPAEFNDQKKVMDAWRMYQERVRESFTPENEAQHDKRVTAAQSGMIFQVMHCVGLKNLSEGDIQTQAYVSQGFVDRDKLYQDSLRAMPQIAETLKEQRELTQIIVAHLPGGGGIAPQPPAPYQGPGQN